MLALLVAFPWLTFQASDDVRAVPLTELELDEGDLLPELQPSAFPYPSWELDRLPWAWLDGAGEARVAPDEDGGGYRLFVRSPGKGELRGTLAVPRASGDGFLRLGFRLPAGVGATNEDELLAAELRVVRERLARPAPGRPWFLRRALDLEERLSLPHVPPEGLAQWSGLPAADAMALFTGRRALDENLQLERVIPLAGEGGDLVAIESLPGLEVRALDWRPLLKDAEPAIDALAALVPADQHALLFPSFQALSDGVHWTSTAPVDDLLAGSGFEPHVLRRLARQLALEADVLDGPAAELAGAEACLTSSDPYLEAGTDVALLIATPTDGARAAVERLVAARQAATGLGECNGRVGAVEWTGRVAPDRSISSYTASLGSARVVTSSLAQLERLVQVAADPASSLARTDEFRFFRQRHARDTGESAFLVLSDAALRRWCSPRWRIGAARRVRVRSRLADLQVRHAEELVRGGFAEQALPADDDLDDLVLGPGGVRSAQHGTLAFQTPIAELDLARVTELEAQRYRAWREGYQRNWSAFFDPACLRVELDESRVAFDLSVLPLIDATAYRDLRELTSGPGLAPGAGDPHEGMLVGATFALNADCEVLRSAQSAMRELASGLDVDPLSWLGDWFTLFADDGPIWEQVLEAEDPDEALENLRVDLSEVPIVFEVGVSSPMRLALFLTSLRAFVERTAPGLTEWVDHVEGGRRFVEIRSRGVADDLSLFYAALPEALVVSLSSDSVLRAIERWEARRTVSDASQPAADAMRPHAVLELRGRGPEVLWTLVEPQLLAQQRVASLDHLPILDEWKRLFPDRDPVEVHERVLGERPTCPGGGEFVWDADWHTMTSTVFGHPGEPRMPRTGRALGEAFSHARLALTFEDQGLRAQVELRRE